MSRVRHIWRERPFWRDDNGEWMGQIRDCIDGYVMTVSLAIQPTTIQENMDIYFLFRPPSNVPRMGTLSIIVFIFLRNSFTMPSCVVPMEGETTLAKRVYLFWTND